VRRKLPHENVFVRLGLSPVHGIGVFAIRSIPKGTNIFENDAVEMVWVEKAELEAADPTPEERRFYRDFGIHREGKIGCPVNFHNLTPGWYLNEPGPGQEANVSPDDDFNFTAARDIAEGEELTIRYRDFSHMTE
jgi:SET domain-containing protein